MSKTKTIASITFLMIALIIASIFQFFLNIEADACFGRRRHPPLGRTMIKHFVYPDGTPIGAGLEVTIWNSEPLETQTTDQSGTVIFTPYPDGTYTFVYYWQDIEQREAVEIRCTQIVWEFTNEVPFWTVQKYFYYDTIPPEPISHLTVELDGQVAETDHEGLVAFKGVKAGEYTLMWLWGGVQQTEGIEILFQTPSPVVLTNYLEPKSGGGKKTFRVEFSSLG